MFACASTHHVLGCAWAGGLGSQACWDVGQGRVGTCVCGGEVPWSSSDASARAPCDGAQQHSERCSSFMPWCFVFIPWG